MQTEFRKILEDFGTYQKHSQNHIAKIEDGNSGVLESYVTQLQAILSKPDEAIIPKVLAIRFARAIMLSGRQDVVKQLTRILPAMIKICCHPVQKGDQNPGHDIFANHPESRSVDSTMHGTTFYLLTLQSILHWAKWVPVDETGRESEFSQAYNYLLNKQITFPKVFHYYKNCDTEKFQNTYRMQFFSQSSMAEQFSYANQSHSRLSSNISHISTSIKKINDVQNIKNYLINLNDIDQNIRYNKIDQLHTKSIQIYTRKYKQNVWLNEKEQIDKKWLEEFIISCNLFRNNQIGYHEFIKKNTVEEIKIAPVSHSHLIPVAMPKISKLSENMSVSSREFSQPSDNQQMKKYEDIMRKLKREFESQKRELVSRLEEAELRNEQLKNEHEKQLQQLQNRYQQRMQKLKIDYAGSNISKSHLAFQENEKLKSRISQLEKGSRDYSNGGLQTEGRSLRKKMQSLSDDNSRLRQQLKIMHINLNELKRSNPTSQPQKPETETSKHKIGTAMQNMPINEPQGTKYAKIISNLNNQLAIYKAELANERDKNRGTVRKLEYKISQLQKTDEQLKEKNLFLEKKNDLRDIEAAELEEQVKMFKSLISADDKGSSRIENFQLSPRDNGMVLSGSEMYKASRSNFQSSLRRFNYEFKKYEQLKNTISRDKQLSLRLARSGLKTKDVLLRFHELEIGVITNPEKLGSMQFLLHFTNTSNNPIQKIQLDYIYPPHINLSNETKEIFHLQSLQQQKMAIKCHTSTKQFLCSFYEPIRISITLTKNNQQHTTDIYLPYFMFKNLSIGPAENNFIFSYEKIMLQFQYCRHMLPQNHYLQRYFDGITQLSNNKYSCEIREKQFGYTALLCFTILNKQLKVELQEISTATNVKEHNEITTDLLSFIEFSFKK